MAILIQEVSGSRFGDRFYPHISGVAQSFNYYPVAYTQPQDGIANIAVGLGKYVVEGGGDLPVLSTLPRDGHAAPPRAIAHHPEAVLRPGHEPHLRGPLQRRGCDSDQP